MNWQKVNIFIISFFFPVFAMSQTNANAPLSLYGLGLVEQMALTPDLGFASANTAMANNYSINVANPASFAAPTYQLADFGLQGNLKTIGSPNGNFKTSGAHIRNFNFLFPIANKMGVCFGLKPYSTSKFEVSDQSIPFTSAQITNTIRGVGGINNLSGGFGFEIFKDTTQVISIGANLNYLFGSKEVITQINYTLAGASPYGTYISDKYLVRDFTFDFGIQYFRKLNNQLTLGFGATYTPQRNLKTTQNYFASSYTTASNALLFVDTALTLNDTGTSILATKMGFGLSLQWGQSYTIFLDYKMANRQAETLINKKLNQSAFNQFAIGVQYIPDPNEITKILQTAKYRLGFKYAQIGVIHDGGNVQNMATTLGIGIPLSRSQSVSSFNFGLEVGLNNNTIVKTYREQYTLINVGVTIAPHKFDRWFYKRKID